MAETIRTKSALIALLADNTILDIDAQEIRDLLESVMGVNAVASVSTTATLDDDHEFIKADASGGAFTITLPAVASTRIGKMYIIKKTDVSANVVTVDGNGAETIDGVATYALSTQWDTLAITNDGTQWLIKYVI